MTLQWLDEAPAMLPLHLPGQCLEALEEVGIPRSGSSSRILPGGAKGGRSADRELAATGICALGSRRISD